MNIRKTFTIEQKSRIVVETVETPTFNITLTEDELNVLGMLIGETNLPTLEKSMELGNGFYRTFKCDKTPEEMMETFIMPFFTKLSSIVKN
jgi:hypothetical protein